MKREKIMKWMIYLVGAICLFLFISVRILPMYNLILKEKLIPGYWDATKYGECYYFNYIKYFREEGLPEANTKFQYSNQQANLNEADILAFGDSFFDISRGTQFPKMLAEKSLKKVHYVYQELPLSYLKRNNYSNNSPRIMILGVVERYIPVKFGEPVSSDYEVDNRSDFRKAAAWLKDMVFYQRSEELYDVILKRSYFTKGIYTVIATAKFDLFGYISKLTPKYKADPDDPWLFYFDQVNHENTSFYYDHSEQEMEDILQNIKNLADKLKTLYNIELVFLPIPAQYTLYHDVINQDDYNDFLPRLYEGLEGEGISFINIYHNFNASNEVLYYGTDGHWRVKGIEMAADIVLDYLYEGQYPGFNQ